MLVFIYSGLYVGKKHKTFSVEKYISLKNIFPIMACWYFLFLPLISTVHAQGLDYKAQSLYLYQFSRFIYWPKGKMESDFVIGVYGSSPIIEELKLMASLKKTGNGMKIIVKNISEIQDSMDLHILYVSASKSREIKNIVGVMDDLSILIVAERGGLAKKGACINFIILENDTLRFEVNQSAMKKRNLEIADELLKLGFIVG